MSTPGFQPHRGAVAAVLAALALAAVVLTRPASANEPQGDLNVALRLVELVPGTDAAGPSKTGVARIEVLVDALHATSDLELRILRPDGSAWTVKGRPYATGAVTWTDPQGGAIAPGAHGHAIPARGAGRAIIAVPLEGAAIHEIVVAVTGLSGGAPVATEGVVRAALGVADNRPLDDGAYANFPVKGVK